MSLLAVLNPVTHEDAQLSHEVEINIYLFQFLKNGHILM